MKRLVDVLNRLSSTSSVSGTQIAKELGITRAAVWRRIKHLQDLGVEILSDHGKGYKLQSDFEKLDAAAIKKISPNSIALDIVWNTTSTNSDLFSTVDKVRLPAVLLAEYQTNGRGRRNEPWVSPLGSGLCMSMGWKFSSLPPTIPSLGLVVGLTIIDTLEKFGCPSIKIKWPNDVFFGQKKIAGSLIDLKTELSGFSYVVIGIGINTKMNQEAKKKINQPVADLYDILGTNVSRNDLAGNLIKFLNLALTNFEKDGFSSFRDKFIEKDLLYGKKINIAVRDNIVTGYAAGVDWDGALLLDVDGKVSRFYSGHVSLIH